MKALTQRWIKIPVRRVGNKWAIGSGKAIYDSKEKAERSYRAYLAKKYGRGNDKV